MTLKNWMLSLLTLLLVSCAGQRFSKAELKETNQKLNSSDLYDPAVVTTKKGVKYEFEEGTYMGTGRKFVSQSRLADILHGEIKLEIQK